MEWSGSGTSTRVRRRAHSPAGFPGDWKIHTWPVRSHPLGPSFSWQGHNGVTRASAPLWFIWLVVVSPLGYLTVRKAIRSRPGSCRACGYSMTDCEREHPARSAAERPVAIADLSQPLEA